MHFLKHSEGAFFQGEAIHNVRRTVKSLFESIINSAYSNTGIQKWRSFKFSLLSYLEFKDCEEKYDDEACFGQNDSIRSKFPDFVIVLLYDC